MYVADTKVISLTQGQELLYYLLIIIAVPPPPLAPYTSLTTRLQLPPLPHSLPGSNRDVTLALNTRATFSVQLGLQNFFRVCNQSALTFQGVEGYGDWWWVGEWVVQLTHAHGSSCSTSKRCWQHNTCIFSSTCFALTPSSSITSTSSPSSQSSTHTMIITRGPAHYSTFSPNSSQLLMMKPATARHSGASGPSTLRPCLR